MRLSQLAKKFYVCKHKPTRAGKIALKGQTGQFNSGWVVEKKTFSVLRVQKKLFRSSRNQEVKRVKVT